jgi:predicted nucleic acid-binding protein
VTRGLLDTSVFIAQESGRSLDVAALPDELTVSVITIGELRAGVLLAWDISDRARRLSTLEQALALDPVPVDGQVADAWARLRVSLLDVGRRMRVNDAWIAATALALNVPLVTQDADFAAVPGLPVVRV